MMLQPRWYAVELDNGVEFTRGNKVVTPTKGEVVGCGQNLTVDLITTNMGVLIGVLEDDEVSDDARNAFKVRQAP
jgi:hypothetical protein